MWPQHYDIQIDIHTDRQTYIHTDRQTEPKYDTESNNSNRYQTLLSFSQQNIKKIQNNQDYVHFNINYIKLNSKWEKNLDENHIEIMSIPSLIILQSGNKKETNKEI